jgi:hypothetical protein
MVPEARRHPADDLPDVRRFRRGLVTLGTVEETALVRLLDTPELQRLKWNGNWVPSGGWLRASSAH